MALYAAGQKVMARHEGVFRNAQIERVEEFAVRPTTPPPAGGPETPVAVARRYYVHWFDFDRRLDQWVAENEIAPMNPAATKSAKAKAQTKGTTVMTRQMVQRGATVEDTLSTPPPLKGNAMIPGRRGGSGDSKFFYVPKNVSAIHMGHWEVPAWYFSPYLMARPSVRSGIESAVDRLSVNTSAALNLRGSPIAPELLGNSSSATWSTGLVLHICPYCCAPHWTEEDVQRHYGTNICLRRPPGREIYRDTKNRLALFEVDGVEERTFAQHLALLSKLFLEHKFLDYDMSPFVFYVLCVVEKEGCEIAAYYSREKRSPDNYNLSCILSLPQFQGKGYGRFLVEVSYEMSKREGRPGSPERPLSDLGERLYHAYWADVVLDVVVHHKLHGVGVLPPLTIEKITELTGMLPNDITLTLKNLKLLSRTSDVHLTESAANAHEMARLQRKAQGKVSFKPHLLVWSPRQYKLTPTTVDYPPDIAAAESGSSNRSTASASGIGRGGARKRGRQ